MSRAPSVSGAVPRRASRLLITAVAATPVCERRCISRSTAQLTAAEAEQVEITVKYEGYIRRQLRQVEDFANLEKHLIPENTDYSAIQGLRLEAREKLALVQPRNLGQAGRVSGVSPADIAALMIYLEKR